MDPIIFVVVALLIGLGVGWYLGGRPSTSLRSECEELRARCGRADIEVATFQERSRDAEMLRTMREEVTRERDAALEQLAALRPVAARTSGLEEELAKLRIEKEGLVSAKAAFERGESERALAHEAQLNQLKELQAKVESRFGELAGKAVEGAQDLFLKRADERFGHAGKQSEEKLTSLLQPVRETLARYEAGLKEIEQARTGAYEGLKVQIGLMREGQERVASEASRLRTTLRSSSGSVGRWGEDQCENVLERAGLQEGIDFEKQVTSEEPGDRARPDFVVRLPGNRRLIIDVKCSLDAYVGATETEDEILRDKLLVEHAKAIKAHAQGLMRKSYQASFKNSADFVVMFVPGENFLHAAIQRDRQLLSWSHGQNVIIAGPTSLVSIALNIASLRGQEKMNERAEEIAKVGRQLYANLSTLGKKSHTMAKSIQSTLLNWNDLVKTLDGNLLVSARKFDEMGVGKGSLDVRELELIETLASEPQRLLVTICDGDSTESSVEDEGIE